MARNQPAIEATKKPAKSSPQKPGGELRKPQVRVLAALAKSKQPMTRAEISAKSEVDVATLTEYIGSSDKTVRAKNDKRKGFKSLLTLGYMMVVDSEDAATKYRIPPKGRWALGKQAG